MNIPCGGRRLNWITLGLSNKIHRNSAKAGTNVKTSIHTCMPKRSSHSSHLDEGRGKWCGLKGGVKFGELKAAIKRAWVTQNLNPCHYTSSSTFVFQLCQTSIWHLLLPRLDLWLSNTHVASSGHPGFRVIRSFPDAQYKLAHSHPQSPSIALPGIIGHTALVSHLYLVLTFICWLCDCTGTSLPNPSLL